MNHTIRDVGVAKQIGAYSDAIEVALNARWLLTSGTPGLALDGRLPSDITGQAELAWTHIISLLKEAEMTVNDLVKVTHIFCTFPTFQLTLRCARVFWAMRGRPRCC